ncbi:MAG: AIPR family protein [Chloroflexota bacterium]|nr:AIPR family protein [Chloroflexota bacterium]
MTSVETRVTFEAFREQWLEEVRAGNPSTTELGHRFAQKLFTQWRDISEPSEDLVYCDGTGDGGIDIAFLDRAEPDPESGTTSGDTWYLVQSKYGKAFQGTNTLLEEGQKVIETLSGQRSRLTSLSENLLERLNQYRRRAGERDQIVLVFATESALTPLQLRVLEDVRNMGRGRIGQIFDVETISIGTIYSQIQEGEGSGVNALHIPMKAKLVNSGKDLLVGSIPLLNLYEFLKNYRNQTQDLDRLYEKNVRRFLGSRKRVNKAMQQTLQNVPELFGLYNNGITIVVTGFDETDKDNGLYDLIDPYVVNGCQTTRTIWDVFHQRLESGGNGTDPELENWRNNTEQGAAVLKIVKVGAKREDLLQAITRYTNSQNAVSEKDFLTLENDFQRWKREMTDQYDIFLEIQRGGWDSQRASQRQNPRQHQFTKWVNAFDLIKIYGAGWMREAGEAFGSNQAFVPNGRLYKKIVETSDEPFGVEDLYAAYLLRSATNTFKFGRRSEKISRRLTRYLFYMVVMDLLRDVMIRANRPNELKDLTRAILNIFKPSREAAKEALLNTALEVIDEYMTQGTEDSVFTEPMLKDTFNSDLNAFLKWEKLGKGDSTPSLSSLLGITKRTMSRGQPAPRDLITREIQ